MTSENHPTEKMTLTFLGGASAIGGSSILIEGAGTSLLIDCGVRFKSSNPLPDLGVLNEKKLDAILVTHAHSDHTGGLAIVHEAFLPSLFFVNPHPVDII